MTTQYKPKAIRGLKYPKHIKISIRQVEKLFENGQEFTGFLVGNNVNTFHFFGGWHLALTIKVTAFDIFKTYYNSFKLYLDPELGDNVAIFLEDSEFQK